MGQGVKKRKIKDVVVLVRIMCRGFQLSLVDGGLSSCSIG